MNKEEPYEQTLQDCILYIQIGDKVYTVEDLKKIDKEKDGE